MKFGVIAAMNEEMEEIEKIMNDIEEKNIYEIYFYKGKIEENEIILVECGVGKVNAARVTQLLIDKFDVDIVINIGSGAAASDELEIGDIVIGKTIVQHDFDITAFGHPKGFISNIGENIKSNVDLTNKMKELISKISEENNKYKVKIGTIASGDIFCTEIKMKDKIKNKFNADIIDMESSAIAQVCKLDDKPFIIIRSVSDKPNGNNQITFDEFLKFASKRCAIILQEFIKSF